MYQFFLWIVLLGVLSGCGGGGSGDSSNTTPDNSTPAEPEMDTGEVGSPSIPSTDQLEVFDFGLDTGVLAPEYFNSFRVDSLTDEGFVAPYTYNLENNSVTISSSRF